MGGIEIAHIAPAHRLHQLRQALRGLRRGQQMKMVAHQHIGMDSHVELSGVLQQQVQQGLVIRRRVKNGLAIIAALNDVVRIAGQCKTGKSGHG